MTKGPWDEVGRNLDAFCNRQLTISGSCNIEIISFGAIEGVISVCPGNDGMV